MSEQFSMFGDTPPQRKKSPKLVKISLSKTISSSPENIFDRWLIPTFVGNWMFGPHVGDDGLGDMRNEVRPGGQYSYDVYRHGALINFSGQYEVIDRPNHLKFSWQESGGAVNQFLGLKYVSMKLFPLDEKTQLKVGLEIDKNEAKDPRPIKELWTLRCKMLASKLD